MKTDVRRGRMRRRTTLLGFGAVVALAGALLASPAIAAPATASLTATPSPTLTGAPRVGATLTAVTGTWAPATVTLRYQWKRDATAIAGATAKTYRPVAADAGAKVSVTVTGSKTGFTTTSRTSLAPLVTAAVTAPSAISGDGLRVVGTTLAPGTYVTAGTAKGCLWKRLSAVDSRFESVLGESFGYGQRIVQIAATDRALITQNCGAWKHISSAGLTRTAAIAGDGVRDVSRQLTPGLYRASSVVGGCVWERTRAHGGNLAARIAHAYSATTVPTVRIAATDVGFVSTRCGSWTRISG